MENYSITRLTKVLNLLYVNRRKIEKEKQKIETLNEKLQKVQQKLNKLEVREEKLRDSYDFYYGQYYMGNKDGKLKVTNAHNRHLLNNASRTKKETERVNLPEFD